MPIYKKNHNNKKCRHVVFITGAFLCGALFRCYQLSTQILVGDEWHSVFVALRSSYAEIFSTFGSGCHSIPIALYYRFLIDTFGLSEFSIHIPFLFSGILTIVLLPFLVRSILGFRAASIFAWLLALSPVLIFYSRFARPYGIVVLLGFSAVILFYKWWIHGGRMYAISYVILGSVTGFFHVVALPFVLGPILYFMLTLLFVPSGDRRNRLQKLLKIGLGISMASLLLLGLPVWNSFNAISNKAGTSGFEFTSIFKALRLLLCTSGGIFITSCMVASIIIILLTSFHKRNQIRPFYTYLLFVSLFQFMFILLSRPIAFKEPHIFARYIILIQPVLLLLSAAGIEKILQWIHSNKIVQTGMLLFIYTVLIFKSPIPSTVFRYNNAAHVYLLDYMRFGDDYENHIFTNRIKRVPEFYKQLSKDPSASKTIVEAPFHYNGYHIFAYQLIHHQTVFMGLVKSIGTEGELGEMPAASRNVHFRNFININDQESLHTNKVDYIIFHKHLHHEINYRPEYQHQDVSEYISQYQSWYGSPTFEDPYIVVFSLKRGQYK